MASVDEKKMGLRTELKGRIGLLEAIVGLEREAYCH